MSVFIIRYFNISNYFAEHIINIGTELLGKIYLFKSRATRIEYFGIHKRRPLWNDKNLERRT